MKTNDATNTTHTPFEKLISAGVAAAFALTTACGGTDAADEYADDAITNVQSSPTGNNTHNPGSTTGRVRGRCGDGAVLFDGACRAASFFERFLSEDAQLIGVSGPVATSAADTGVVVLEASSEGSYQELYIQPTKLALGAPRNTRVMYRADYPVVHMRVTTLWQDDTGHLNTLVYALGPVFGRTGLTPLAWMHRIATPSGYEGWDSDGNHVVVSQSGGSGDYCDVGAIAAGGLATAACLGADVFAAAAAGAVSAIATGAVVFVIGTSSTFGVGAGPAAVAALGTGATVGVGVFGTTAAAGSVVCGILGTVVSAATSVAVCSDDIELEAQEIEFAPLRPRTPITVSGSASCPNGMMPYTGYAVQCSESSELGTSTILDDEGNEMTIEQITVMTTCVRTWVSNECVFM